MEKYNQDNIDSKLNLVLFSTAIEHLVRIVRVLSTPNGHTLLVGVGGSGKRSLARLSTYICTFKIYQIEIVDKYDYDKWLENLCDLFIQCGLDNEKTVFMLSDT